MSDAAIPNDSADAERFFCKVALSMGIVTPAAVQECLAAQRNEPVWRRIGEVLMERGYLDRDQLRAILQMQEQVQGEPVSGGDGGGIPVASSEPDSTAAKDVYFDALVKLKRLAAEGSLQVCYDLHEVLLRSPEYRRLSGRLMRKAYCVASSIEDPLRLDGRKVVRCKSCHEIFHVPEEADDRFIPCRTCGNLILKEPEAETDPMSKTSAAARAIAQLDAKRAEEMREAKRRAAESVGEGAAEADAGEPDEAVGGEETIGREQDPSKHRSDSAERRIDEVLAAAGPDSTRFLGSQLRPDSTRFETTGLRRRPTPHEADDDPLARAPGMLPEPAAKGGATSEDDPLAGAPGMLEGASAGEDEDEDGGRDLPVLTATEDVASPDAPAGDDDFQTSAVPPKPQQMPFVKSGGIEDEDDTGPRPSSEPAVRFDARPKSTGRRVWRPRIR